MSGFTEQVEATSASVERAKIMKKKTTFARLAVGLGAVFALEAGAQGSVATSAATIQWQDRAHCGRIDAESSQRVSRRLKARRTCC